MKLNASRVVLAEQVIRIWSATAEYGTALTDVLDPSYWAHKASVLRPRDEIKVWCEDNSWCAELIVIEAAANWARVIVKSHLPLVAKDIEREPSLAGEPEHTDGLFVYWRGPAGKFACAMRDPTDGRKRTIIKEGFNREEDAIAFMLEQRRRSPPPAAIPTKKAA